MLLIGQFDSPFVRRVGITLEKYGCPYEHRPYAVFRDADQIARFNPLRKVPTLVLDDGTVLTESLVCLDVLDEDFAARHGHDSARLLLPRQGPVRRAGLRLCGFSTGLCEKAVSLVYEHVLREEPLAKWTARCETQIRGTLALLEHECATRNGEYMLGDAMSHADIALVTAMTFIGEAHPDLLDPSELPALRALAECCEQEPDFERIRQPFIVNT